MPQDLAIDPRPTASGAEIGMLRLRTLVRLRWLAIVGQAGAVLGVYFVLGFPLPLGPCLVVIALSAWLNIFLTIRWRKSMRLHETHAGLLLVYDVIQLAVLLFLTGGLENPFSFLFLVPVTISATSLPNRWSSPMSRLRAATPRWSLPIAIRMGPETPRIRPPHGCRSGDHTIPRRSVSVSSCAVRCP